MKNKALLILAGLIIVGLAVGFTINKQLSKKSTGTNQTPAVSQNTNPDEAAPDATKDWQISQNAAAGISFKYPANLGTTYIGTNDWPPQAQVLNTPFSCTQAGSANDRAGRTEQITVNNHTYCVTKSIGAAAGSIYDQYAYAFEKDNKEVILTFTLRYPQCGNYVGTQKTACENEEQTFDVNALADQIAQTVSLN